MAAKRNAPTVASSNRSFLAVLLILLVIGVAVIGFFVFKPKDAATVVATPPAAAPAKHDTTPLPPPKGWVQGSEKAPVEIVMFGDFECPGCGQFARMTEPDVEAKLVKTGLVRFRFMDYPLPSIHAATLVAHNAAACAGDQGKFWEMHNKIYELQHEWSTFANGRDMDAAKVMKRYAKELGLVVGTFSGCLDTRHFEAQIRANYEEGVRQGVGATPTFVVGIRMIAGAQPYDVIKKMVDSATADAKKLSTSSTPK